MRIDACFYKVPVVCAMKDFCGTVPIRRTPTAATSLKRRLFLTQRSTSKLRSSQGAAAEENTLNISLNGSRNTALNEQK